MAPGRKHVNSNLVSAPTTQGGFVSSRRRLLLGNHVHVPMPNTQHGVTRSGGIVNENRVPTPSTQDAVTNFGSGASQINANCIPTPSTHVGGTSASTGKNVRKKSVNNKLTEFLRLGGNVRPRIEILPELTVPLGQWAKAWSTEMGIIVRQHVPLRFHNWKEVKQHTRYTTLFQQVLKRFDVDFSQPHVVSAVDGHFKKLYKEYRHELHVHYLDLPDNVDKPQHPRKDVAQDDWAHLCAWWETDEFKRKSATNKRSRTKMEVLHRGGTKNFVRHRYDLTNPETNEQPDVIALYKFTHHNLKKGWVALRAEENYERMVEASTQPIEEGGDPLTADGAREKVLGKRSGYARGLGYGVVVPTSATAAATAAAAAAGAAATAAARAEMDALRQRAEVAENQLRELTAQQANQQRQLEYIMSRLGSQTTPP